ncbi:MAG: Holliday junction resolvase RuvX [SAR202 cluster bacterium]|nr:Holliday junction resolvase RuvX [Chloroflexota bacterium]MQG58636.1 Holliday junction resolvase RuvX [SAR202 cluster bacterium]MQG69300.1 Holliday junction resolvase RuvX [SAR202 cluster bacterium]HAL47104.1 Holliday junction resolvase RuvX [Dehalococcoidia bacterium]
MRIMALDVGDRRIGVALSDPTGLLATPHSAVDRKYAKPSDIDEIAGIARENDVEAIIVGLPRSLSGRLGDQAKLVTTFVSELSTRIDLPVSTVDERYTTVQAERMLRESGRQPSRDRGRVDASAAAVMLQAYLDSQR